MARGNPADRIRARMKSAADEFRAAKAQTDSMNVTDVIKEMEANKRAAPIKKVKLYIDPKKVS